MKKILSIIIICLIICGGLGVQGKFFENITNFEINNNDNDTIFNFKISNLDNSPLINSTFLGGNYNDGDYYTGANIFQDINGNVFIAGTTESSDFPITNNVYSNIISGGKDVFITKFDNNLSKILASTYIGGSSTDEARGLYIDDNGNIYVSGITESNDFPVTDNAYQQNFHGGTEGPYGNGDSFLIKLDNNLTFLLGSTYIGGSGHECCSSVVVDNNDFIFISGSTSSVDFPITENAFDSSYNPNGYFGEDVYISKFSNDLSTLISSTFLGGNGDDFSESIKIDQFGNLFISGWTSSANFPTSIDAFDRIFGGGYYDGFITKLNNDLSILEASTYLGDSDWDFCYDMTLDENNNVYVTGHTASTNFPTTPGSFCEEYQGSGGANEGDDVFISRFIGDLTDLTASTFFGGSRWENGFSIIASGNRVYITGTTSSYDFPISNDAFSTEFQGGIRSKGDLFISIININLDDLYASTYLGSNRNEAWGQIIIDDEEKIIVTGSTSSTDFPVTINAYDANHNGGYDIFISRFQNYLSYQQPPFKPNKPIGISNGKTGEEYEYITSTSDPENDDIYYLFDWGDGSTSFILGPYASGEECSAVKIWFEEGNYEIKVKAIDEHGSESEWSDPLVVSMPKNKLLFNNASLSGYVIDTSCNPIGNVRVRVDFHETFEEDFTDEYGYYYVKNIPYCYCLKNVTVSKNGYKIQIISLSISNNSIQNFTLIPLDAIYVDDDGTADYNRIQDAIEHASDGDTIFVFSGIYKENIELDKRLSLIGEDKNTTIIDGNQEGCTINLSSENVIIKDFTIIGGGFDTDDFTNFFRAGIRVTGSNNTICNNIFRKNCLGLSGVRVTNLTIKDNIFIEDGLGFTSYENDGRPLMKIKYFLHNIDNNIVNGKPLYYFVNEKDKVIDNWEIGQLILVNCTNIRIKNVSISKTDWGLVFAFSNKCTIEYCKFFNNSLAIWTLESNNNLFQFNNISNNYHRGVVIDYNSNTNQIKYNKIDTTFCGVEIEWWSNSNIITKNNFLNNNVSGYEHQSLFSRWNKNYYDDWIGLENPLLFFYPKLIYGMPIEIIPSFIMIVSIDFHPAKEPYGI